MSFQEFLGALSALTDSLAVKGVPGSAFLQDSPLTSQIDDLSFVGNSRPVQNVELRLLERRSELVFDHFHSGTAPDDIFALLERSYPPNIHANGGIKLERVSPGRRLGVAEHDADLHSDLIDESHHCLGARYRGGQFAQGLRHEPRLKPHMGVSHLSLDLRLGHQGGYGVNH